MALEVTDGNFEALRRSNKFMVLDFWAEWCGPCRMIASAIDALATKYDGRVAVGKVNVDANNEIVALFGVRNIPTVLFFKDGEVVDRMVGAAPESSFVEKVESLIAKEAETPPHSS
ncbi:MAG: thioredoxin [Tannerellaceae bacterium]|jgi:thioredoxin 1|nr:thioredoxin [Tannerellaceae bacterium]